MKKKLKSKINLSDLFYEKKILWLTGAVVIIFLVWGFFSGLISFLFVHQSDPAGVAKIVDSGNLWRCREARGFIVDGIDYEAICRENIFRRQAFEKGDINACENLRSDFNSVDDCRRQVIISQIDRGSDVSVCRLAHSDFHSSCVDYFWFTKAKQTLLFSDCEKIKDSASRFLCADQLRALSFFRSNETLSIKCSDFSPERQSDCYLLNMVKSGGLSGCDSLNDPQLRLMCQTYHSRDIQ